LKATYNLSGNFLQERLPEELNPERHDANAHPDLYDEYKRVSSSLRTIPCSEECKSVFRDGGVYEQGKDYEVGKKHPDETDVAAPELMAFPLSQPVQEDDWAALFLLIHMNAQEYKDLLGNNHPGLPNNEQWHKAMINELKKHFTLQRKQDTAKAGD
jgi:hypothetical protein